MVFVLNAGRVQVNLFFLRPMHFVGMCWQIKWLCSRIRGWRGFLPSRSRDQNGLADDVEIAPREVGRARGNAALLPSVATSRGASLASAQSRAYLRASMSRLSPNLSTVPVIVEFVAGTRLYVEPPHKPGLPILGNGPPGTFVRFAGGGQVPLPTDQIVLADDSAGAARVGFGGMRFDGIEGGQLVFRRVRDLWPEAQLSPERGRRMTLEFDMVAAVLVEGRVVWPLPN